jgi:3-hydroxyacyl-[acyl-carrier-protein] dehydratase
MSQQLFSIAAIEKAEDKVTATLLLNAAHPILKGHFPDQPVVPGACLVQAVKNVMEQAFKTRLWLCSAANIKFISMLVPGDQLTSRLTVKYNTADEGYITFNATLVANDVVSFKMQGSYSRS